MNEDLTDRLIELCQIGWKIQEEIEDVAVQLRKLNLRMEERNDQE